MERIGGLKILSELGSGGMGTVYLAKDADGRERAVKVLHRHLVESDEFFERFRREAEIGQRIEHPNVVRTLRCDAADGQHFLVMEYVEGQTLRALLRELGTVPEELCRHIGREVTAALAAIHAHGVVHRDLKPENVLITPDHEVKVMDLGVARLQEAALKLSQTGAFLGSLLYAAPEQFGGKPDERADFYSLGVMLYELATGRRPFPDGNFTTVMARRYSQYRAAAEVNPQVSPFYEEVCRALLLADPAQRLNYFPGDEESEWWESRARAIGPLRRIRIPRETALYGRDDELAYLRTQFEAGGRVVLIEGEAGVGKTRLVDEFVASLDEPVHFLFGSYPPGGAATAAGAFTTAFGAQGDFAPYLTATPLLVPAFQALLRGEPPPRGVQPLTKDAMQAVFVHATRGLAAERPTVILIDDLHFAPVEGLALFMALAMGVPEHRVLLIGTMRRGVSEEWIAGATRLEHCERLALGRLGPKDLVRLLEDSFQSDKMARELSARIALKSDGNPFFAFEIVRGLKEGQFLRQREDGSWVTTSVIGDIEIPSSVLSLIRARIASLADEERDLLDVAACCGFEFDPLLVADALGLDPVPLIKRLARIEKRHRLVHSAGRRFRFDHHQVQEALYESMSELLREPYHAALGDALEARDPTAVVSLCDHFLRGARGDKAVDYLKPALDRLHAAYASEAAIDLADRALAVPGLLEGEARGEALLHKGACLDPLGRREEQQAALDEALALAEGPELRIRTRLEAGRYLCNTGRYADARARFDEALEIADDAGDDALKLRAAGGMGMASFGLGKYDETLQCYERHLEMARAAGDKQAIATALGNRGLVGSHLGRLEEAQVDLEEAREMLRELEDRRGVAVTTGNLGLVQMRLGRLRDAYASFEGACALAREIGDRQCEAANTGNLGLVAMGFGRLGDAMKHMRRDHELAREIGDVRGEAISLGNVGWTLWFAGATDEAMEWTERQLALAREIGGQYAECYALSELAGMTEVPDPARARELYDEALALRRSIGFQQGVAETLVVMGRFLVEEGDETAAIACLDECIALAREINLPSTLMFALAYRARLPGGDVEAARNALESQGPDARYIERMEARFVLWQVTGERAHLEEAHRLLMGLRENTPPEYRETMLSNVPLHRDIIDAYSDPET